MRVGRGSNVPVWGGYCAEGAGCPGVGIGLRRDSGSRAVQASLAGVASVIKVGCQACVLHGR